MVQISGNNPALPGTVYTLGRNLGFALRWLHMASLVWLFLTRPVRTATGKKTGERWPEAWCPLVGSLLLLLGVVVAA
jgi:hypothetical protein